MSARGARDAGLTMIEMMVAAMFLAIIAAVMLNWLIHVTQTDDFEQDSAIALEDMRAAKASLVKELRFAETINPAQSDTHKIVFWFDEDGDESAGPGEIVTWEIHADGSLVRTTDDPAQPPLLQASRLVYDGAAGPDSSTFAYNATFDSVTIELVADVDQTTGPEARRIRTEVHLRS